MIASKDDWVTAEVIVSRIKGNSVKDNSHKYFRENIACQPNFPKPSKFGKTQVWNWGEVSEYFFRIRG